MRIFAAFMMFVLAFFTASRPAEAAVSVHINLSTQTMQVTSGDGQSYSWPISSARAGYTTPRGNYRAQRLETMHYSRKYHMSPMPHSIFFRGGYAIHGTSAVGQLGRPASHGCVRLSPGHAAQLFAMVRQQGAAIQITGGAPRSTMFAEARGKHKRTHYASAGKRHHGKAYASNGHRHKTHYAANHRGHRHNALAYAPARHTTPVKTWQANPANWYGR